MSEGVRNGLADAATGFVNVAVFAFTYLLAHAAGASEGWSLGAAVVYALSRSR